MHWFGVWILRDIVTKKTDYMLDLRDVIAPFTLLKVTQALREMKSGERLEILATDHDTRKYLFQVLDATGHYRMVGIDDRNDFCRIHLEKRGIAPSRNMKSIKNH